MAQVGRLGPKVVSHLALLCIHHVNRVNSRNDWLQHHKDCPRYYYYQTLTTSTVLNSCNRIELVVRRVNALFRVFYLLSSWVWLRRFSPGKNIWLPGAQSVPCSATELVRCRESETFPGGRGSQQTARGRRPNQPVLHLRQVSYIILYQGQSIGALWFLLTHRDRRRCNV